MCDCGVDFALHHLEETRAKGLRGIGCDLSLDRRSLLKGVAAGLLAASLPSALATPARAAESGRFRVGFIAEPAHGLHFLAKEKGYFRDQGLDVELSQFKSAGEGVIALKAGQLDIGTFGSAAPLLYISQGVPFTIFGGMMIGGQAIITRPERLEELKSLENYRGKKVALVRLSTGDVVFRLALKKAGLDPRQDFTRLEFPSPGTVVEAVLKGEVDAGIVFSPHFSLAEKRGLAVAHFIADFHPNYTCCRLTANTADFQQRPDEYGRFLTALIQAYRFYRTNPDETVRIFTDALKIDEDVIRKDTYTRKVFDSNPDPLRKGTLEFWQAMVDADFVANKGYPVGDHINTSVYKTALDAVTATAPQDPVWAEMQAYFSANNTERG
ncbi:ABC transporter substrate-binding protein [Pararhodospirillum photometricum]|uniref:Extracellular solute-binding protein, family 3 n=1 Tax=Pararhodospirillum photometricum DSM 122 TaxID=1150469 RepID=H6SKW1_PARPM|nr:ABC transporter substrate-binding protein [Pararhodospirillum photometricum]CCG08626.1 Extracellular solute-binding protein, family 3 [Pararhodospirillum photometricum DSM 122]